MTKLSLLLKSTLVMACAILVLSACGGEDTPATGQQFANEGQTHVDPGTPLNPKHYPPSSGNHYPMPLPWRFYDVEQADGYWVHDLEHGGVVILYNCGGQPCNDLKKQLDGLYSKIKLDKFQERKLVVTPNSKINTKLAIIAWTWVDQMDAFDETRLLNFFNAHVNKGPEDVR